MRVEYTRLQIDNPYDPVIGQLISGVKVEDFPLMRFVTEEHDLGVVLALGIRLQESHKRQLLLEDLEGGFVFPCLDLGAKNCWDERRFNAKLKTTAYSCNNGVYSIRFNEIVLDY